jgi:ribosomal protein S18 acetylase RimI-like enzyme
MTATSIAVRALGPDDVALAQCVNALFHPTHVSPAYIEQVLRAPGNLLLVAEHGARLAGFLYAHWIDRLRLERPQLFVYEIEVARDYRRAGVGAALLTAALACAQEREARAFVLTRRSNAAGVALYRKLGGIERNADDLLFVFDPKEVK